MGVVWIVFEKLWTWECDCEVCEMTFEVITGKLDMEWDKICIIESVE